MANLTRIKNNQITDSTITNVKIASGTLTGDLMNPQLTFNSNLTLNGNLTVSGNFTAVQSQTTQITDPLITLGMGNPGTSYDLGSVLIRGSGGNRFMGWKENAGAFVFINTSEDGTTTGNIPTTAYSNVIFGNATTIGSSTFSGITLSGNTISASGGLILSSASGTTTISNATVLSSTLSVGSTASIAGTATVNALVSNGAIQGTTIGGSGTATFASVVSNGAIQGTTVGASGNATVSALTVNNSATIGTTLGVTGNLVAGNISTAGTASVGQLTIAGGLQNTPIGNATPSTGNFTTLTASTSLNTSGTATVNALVSNGAIQGTTVGASGNATVAALTVNGSATIGSTLSATGGIQNTPVGSSTPNTGNFTTLTAGTSFNTSGTATVNALVSNGAIQGTAITGSGTGTFASVVSNGAIQGTAITGSGTGTFASVISNGAIQGTTIGASGNATVAALTVNGSATVGTTLSATGGIQNTPIGNVTASSGAFTTLNTTGAITGASTIVTTGSATVNALTVNNAAQIGTTLGVNGVATVNSLVSNTSITAASGTITGNLVVGNLNVQGNLSYINSQTLIVQDPIVELNTGPNGAPLSSNPGFDSGVRPHYYDSADRSAFFGRTNDSGYFEYYSNVISETGNVITGTYGTIKTGNLLLNGLASVGTTLAVGSNATVNGLTVNNSATVGTTLSATGGIQNTVIGNATAAAGYFTTLQSSANTTVNALTINGAATVGTTLGVNGNIVAGNISVTNINATNGVFTNNLTVAGTLTATSNVVANTSGIFYGNTTTGIGAIYAGLPIGYTLLPNVVAQFTTNVNNYAQINTQNLNNGNQASTDFIVTAGNGNDTAYFGDFGIASNTYSYAGYGAIYPNDTYLISNGGNLLLNAGSSGKGINFAVGASDAVDIKAKLDTARFSVNLTTASTNSTNGAIVSLGGLGVAGAINGGSTLNVTGTATVNALVSNGAIQGTTIGGSGTATFASVVSNGAIQGTAISGSGTGTFASVVSNGAIQGTTVGASANATVAALTVNGSATVGTTLSATGGLQNTPIGNATASSGAFTTLTASGLTTITNSTDSTAPTNGAATVTGGLGVAKALNVGTTATLGNVTFSNTTISSNLTNTGITINPNGTGSTVINSGLNTSRTIINGTSANTLVVSGTQVGVNTASFISGATLQVNAVDSILLPVGAQGDRPGSPQAGMFRYSSTAGAIEWYNGTAWQNPSVQTTIAVANTQTGNGSALSFTIPVANATTAGTIVSVNGVVQQPVTSYAVSGNVVTFTEAPSSTDTIDFRVFTTTAQVTSVVDTAGTTGLFLEPTAPLDKIILFKTNGTESLSIQANSEVQVSGNLTPKSNVAYSLGTSSRRWKDLWLSGTTMYLGNLIIKESATNTISFLQSDGTTLAAVTGDVSDPKGIQNTPIGNATPSTGAFTTLSASGQITSTLATGTAPFSVTSTTKVTNLNVEQVDGFHADQAGTVSTIVVRDSSGYANVAGLINSGTNGTGNIGASGAGFNTVFAKATSAQYADLAENYVGDAYYEPGTVVEFGGEYEVTISTNDMSTRVAGVVSTNPAYLMNSGLEGIAIPVALQGRVPCKVTGTVRKGDMMVSAGNGTAKAASAPTMGSVIGKSLENFDGEQGVIEVVVGRL